ncbi:MAG: AAA family ATPase [Chitinispirillaceae bacterium]|nr:AAA family ATPase [Chitinispirillaceae bacterium]
MLSIRHHFGLRGDPFPQDVPVKDLFPLPGLAPLEKRIIFAIEQKAISVITGDVGSGKSTSLRYIASKCHSSEYELISIVGSSFSAMELYRQILLNLGIQYTSYQIAPMISKIREVMLEIASRKVVPILIIDEAHLLKRSVFIQLHTLTQFEFDSRPIMPMILCGQDLLLDHLMSISVRPLASRILGRNHLESIRKEVMEEYLSHHIKLAGCLKKLFSDEAVFAIHQGSGGLLRKANSLAKMAMLACVMDKEQTVAAEHVRVAATEIF